MKIYLAGPLFTEAEQRFNKIIQSALFQHSFKVFLPQDECKGMSESFDIFEKCVEGIDKSDVIVAILDGADADSGTCWEVGYAYKKKPIIGIRTDFRNSGDTGGFNAMLYYSLNSCCVGQNYLKKLITVLNEYKKAP